ncbi:TetR/AcrR family transcriptional regulator [Achromobacter xylosoxidans]
MRELQREQGRDGLTVPAAAARAGVTPSTIYRRWGDLSQLLADVAVEQLQPEQAPPDTGSFYGDLLAWLEQYFDEMSSVPGRAMLRDVLGTPGHEGAGKCDGFTRQQIEAIRERATGGRAGRRGGADHHARGGAAHVWRAVRQPGAERRQDAGAGSGSGGRPARRRRGVNPRAVIRAKLENVHFHF